MTQKSLLPQPEERSFFQRFGLALGLVGAVLAAGAIVLIQTLKKSGGATHKMPEVTMVKIVAPPPAPPPPPPPPKLVEEKMVEQMPVDSDEAKPVDNTPAPAADLGTSITGPGGADGFGLTAGGRGGTIGGNKGKGGGSRWGWYAAQVQATIADALRKNAHTREASFRVEVRVWPDLTGRVTRAQLVGTTGDPAVDAALKSDVLTGLQLKEPPPQGLPLPIVMRLTARRPN